MITNMIIVVVVVVVVIILIIMIIVIFNIIIIINIAVVVAAYFRCELRGRHRGHYQPASHLADVSETREHLPASRP
jgi:hypothetical protein